MGSKVFLFGTVLVSFACSPSYQQRNLIGLPPGRTQSPPKEGPIRPFRFSYNSQDEPGSRKFHEAEGDQTGKILGKYGYTNVLGLYRRVEYKADENGYHATILTNEPGIGKRNPADVIFVVDQVPQRVVLKYDSENLLKTVSPLSPPTQFPTKSGIVQPRIGYGPPVKPA